MPQRFHGQPVHAVKEPECQQYILNVLRAIDLYKDGIIPPATIVQSIMLEKYSLCNTPHMHSLRGELIRLIDKDTLDSIVAYNPRMASRFIMTQPYMKENLAKDLNWANFLSYKLKP